MERPNEDRHGPTANAIRLSLQGKGDVDKSLVVSILAQYFMSRACPVRCIDADPVKGTLSQYTDLNVEGLDLRDGSVGQRGLTSPRIPNGRTPLSAARPAYG